MEFQRLSLLVDRLNLLVSLKVTTPSYGRTYGCAIRTGSIHRVG
jgi:hypothetical protein